MQEATELAAYLANVAAQHRWTTELSDPTFGPACRRPGGFVIANAAGLVAADPAIQASYVWSGLLAFSFPFAAAVTYGVHWLALEHVRSGAALGYALAGVLTAGFALLAARTVIGLIDGTFLRRVPAAGQTPVNRKAG